VRAAGGTVTLIDHDALLRADAAGAVRAVPRDLGPAWYRGWMIPTDRYRQLFAALDAGLVVPPDEYARAHELPGWYPTFEDLTPHSVWMSSAPGAVPAPGDLGSLVAPLGTGPAIVKDFVKSRKHEWHEACHVPDLADLPALHGIVARLVELQEDQLAGGIVVRSFEPFTGAEARVWWLDGRPALVTPHPDTPDARPEPDLAAVEPCVKALGCRFVTTDLALRADGVWRVVEVGDGQVSDLPGTQDPALLMAALTGAVR
jgi:ATP-grasp domain, R2K clade family 3